MTFNVHLQTQMNEYSLIMISENEVVKIAEAYHQGDSSVMISGRNCSLERILKLQIFTVEEPDYFPDKVLGQASKRGMITRKHDEWLIKPAFFGSIGKNVTDQYLTGKQGSAKIAAKATNDNYVDPEQIEAIKNIGKKTFDYGKLIKLLEELNIVYANGGTISIPIIIRAIIDHVPPIFGKGKFVEVIGSYAGGQSLKNAMEMLDNNARDIADHALHDIITIKPIFPTHIVIDYKAYLQLLLREIIVLNK